MNAFSPIGNTASISLTTTSADVALPGDPSVEATVRIFNNSTTNVAHFRFATAPGAVAVTTDAFIAGGSTEVFSIPVGITHVAAVLAAGTGTLLVQRGGGT